MRKPNRITSGVLSICIACLGATGTAQAAIRVAAYNTYNNPDNATEDDWFETVFSAIAAETVDSLAKRPDVVAVSETDTDSSARLFSVLNNLYGVSTYSAVTSSSVGGDRTGVLYDSSTLTLLGWADLTAIGTHPILRAHFRLAGQTGSDSEFYVYAVHLKSGSTSSDKSARAAEAANLRGDADALGQGEHIIYAGDFNMLGSSEGAWANMTAGGGGRAFDAAEAPGQWRDNEDFKRLHSQNPRSPMDDRFDLQFVTGELLDGQGLEYIADSYHVFGNNGTHVLNAAISTGSGASGDVLAGLESASDHLPVVADYEFIPSRIAGDSNRDGLVDGQDFTILKFYYGQGVPEDPASWGMGNFNTDHLVDGQDFTILKAYYGQSAGSAQTAIPEPASAVFLVAVAPLLIRRRQKWRWQ